jgi:hypothetical protein
LLLINLLFSEIMSPVEKHRLFRTCTKTAVLLYRSMLPFI